MIKDFVWLLASSMLCAPLGLSASLPPILAQQRYVLRIVPPVGRATLPGLRCYYKGSSYKLHELCCVMTGEAELGLLTIIITPCIEAIYRENRPNHWELDDTLPVRWFECKQVGKGGWVTEERSRDEVPSRIPESAIVLLTNPSFIEKIAAPSLEVGASHSLNELPLIYFKRTLTKEQYDAGMTETFCALPDIETFHRPADAY